MALSESDAPDQLNDVIWYINPGEKRRFWPMFRSQGYVSVMEWDFANDVDLSNLSLEAIKEYLSKHYASRKGIKDDAATHSRMVHRFINEMRTGDMIVAKGGSNSYLGLGRIVSNYQHEKKAKDNAHRRRVEWLQTFESEKRLPQGIYLARNAFGRIKKESVRDFFLERFHSLSTRTVFQTGVRPDVAQGEDVLGVRKDARAFARLIADKAVSPPLSVGLFGAWGSGKSFFMGLVKEEVEALRGHTSRAYCNQIVSVDFNAWHYVESNLWASLVEQIFSSLRSHLRDDDDANQIFQELETAKQMKAEAQADLAQAEATKQRLETELQAKERQLSDEFTLRDLLASRFWKRIKYEDLPANISEKLEATRIADLARKHNLSVENTWQLVQRSRSLTGRARLLFKGLSPGMKLLLLIGTPIVLIGPSVLLSAAFGSDRIDQFLVTLIAFITSVFTFGEAALSKGNDALSLAESIRGELIGDNQSRLQVLHAELETAQAQIDVATEKIKQAEKIAQAHTTAESIARFVEQRIGTGDYQSHLGIVAMVRKDFEILTSILTSPALQDDAAPEDRYDQDQVRSVDRIVLYIDDLDRCPTEHVIKVLEAIHLMLAFPLFVAMVGVDSRWIEKSLLEHYSEHLAPAKVQALRSEENERHEPQGQIIRASDSATPFEYLEKIFQVPFWIPPISAKASRDLVNSLLDDVDPSDEDDLEGNGDGPLEGTEPESTVNGAEIERTEDTNLTARTSEEDVLVQIVEAKPLDFSEEERRFIEDIARFIGSSPRRAKRYVNTYRLIKTNLRVRSEDTAGAPDDAEAYYPEILTLLALTTGAPSYVRSIFDLLKNNSTELRLSDLRAMSETEIGSNKAELETIIGALEVYQQRSEGLLDTSRLSQWVERIGQFSFNAYAKS